MRFPDQEKVEFIQEAFRKYPNGVTISEISSRMKMNRNLVAKYLDFLVLSGQLQMKSIGSAKQYSLSRRVPVSALVDFSSDLMLMVDEETRILKTNNPLLEHLNEKPDALIGKKLGDVDNPFISSLAKQVKSAGKSDSTAQGTDITGRVYGEQNHYTLKLIAIVFEDGTPGTALILHNVTADRKYRQIRGVSEARDTSMMEDQTEFVVRFRPEGSLTSLNRAFCDFFKRARGECIGRSFRSLVPVEDQQVLETALDQLTRDTPVTTITCRIIGSSGQIRYNEWTLRALFDEAGTIREYQGVGRDITDKHNARETISQYNADMAFLYWKSSEFVDLPGDANIYETIGRGVQELLPEAIVAVISLKSTPSFHYLTTRCFLNEKACGVFSKYMGEDIVGNVMTCPDSMETAHVIQNLLGGKLVKVPGDLFVAMMGQVPREVCRKIEEELDIGDIYILGFISQNTILGDICLMLRKGDTLRHNELLEIYIRQATLALRCKLAEEALKGKKPICPSAL